MGTALPRAGRLRAAPCAAALLTALLTFPQALLAAAPGGPPAKPGPGRDLEAAQKLAERYDGRVVAPEPGPGAGAWIAGLFLDRRSARSLEPITVAHFPKQ